MRQEQPRPRALLVDDEPEILDFLERVLRRRFQVSRCGSAVEAWERLAEAEFDVLITDHMMPQLSGLELLERLGNDRPTMARLLISGFAEGPEFAQARARCRIHKYVSKPVDSRCLLEAVEQAIASRDGEQVASGFGD
jgi:CheY-like chemotaxis protein